MPAAFFFAALPRVAPARVLVPVRFAAPDRLAAGRPLRPAEPFFAGAFRDGRLLAAVLRAPPLALFAAVDLVWLRLAAFFAGCRPVLRTERFAAFLAGDFLAEDFLAGDFLAGDFLGDDFLAGDFLADDFFAADFLAADFFLAAMLASAREETARYPRLM